MIKISNLSFSYGSTPILDKIRIDIKPGEFIGVIGPNGSGKSTLLRIILGFEHNYKGKVELFGASPKTFSDWHRVGYVPQKVQYDSLLPMTVMELLATKGAGKSCLKRLGISHLASQQFHSLSGGQKQKVLIAFALYQNPELLILDEPEAGVDAKSRDDFFKLLRKINQTTQTTIILCSHDVGMISHYCQRILCIHHKHCTGCTPDRIGGVLRKAYGSTFEIHGGHHV